MIKTLGSRFGYIPLLLAMAISASADAQLRVDEEIEQLFVFILTSECEFIRNGRSYSPKKARSHIERKYKYLQDEIFSAEEFIEKTASQSSTTGERYYVKCPGQTNEISSQAWLQGALLDVRVE